MSNEKKVLRMQGRYTLMEAAEYLAPEGGARKAETLQKLMDAGRTQLLPVFKPKQNSCYKYDPTESHDQAMSFSLEVIWKDLNVWLDAYEPTIIWRFPTPEAGLREQQRFAAGLIESVANNRLIDWEHWIEAIRTLSAAQAARLMSGLDPDVFNNLGYWPQDTLLGKQIVQVKKILRLAKDHEMTAATPAAWLAWADKHFSKYENIQLHENFRFQVEAVSRPTQSVAKGAAERGNDAIATGSDDSPHTDNWSLKVQIEATSMFKAWRARGANPTKYNIREDLAKWCRENNVKTKSGIFPDPEYIYRHALRKWSPPDR